MDSEIVAKSIFSGIVIMALVGLVFFIFNAFTPYCLLSFIPAYYLSYYLIKHFDIRNF